MTREHTEVQRRIFLCRKFTLKYGTVLSMQSLSDSVLGNAR